MLDEETTVNFSINSLLKDLDERAGPAFESLGINTPDNQDVKLAFMNQSAEPLLTISGCLESPTFLSFKYNGQEVLRFDKDGSVYIRGEKVDTNQEIYSALKDWIEIATKEVTKR